MIHPNFAIKEIPWSILKEDSFANLAYMFFLRFFHLYDVGFYLGMIIRLATYSLLDFSKLMKKLDFPYLEMKHQTLAKMTNTGWQFMAMAEVYVMIKLLVHFSR